MHKVYFSDLESSCLESVEADKMKPNFIEGEEVYRLSIQRDVNDAFVIYLTKYDLEDLLMALNDVLFNDKEAVFKVKNKANKSELFKYSEKLIKSSHTRYLKLNIDPKHTLGNTNKVSAVIFTPTIFYRKLLLKNKAKKFQVKPFIISRENALYLLSYIEMIIM